MNMNTSDAQLVVSAMQPIKMDESVRPTLLPWQRSASAETAYSQSTSFWQRLQIWSERWKRWEFWPSWLYYVPIVIWLVWLSIKYRNPTAFTAANPALEAGGVVGERKHLPLGQLQVNAPDLVAVFDLLPAQSDRIQRATEFAVKHGLPVVLKPDIGQRGRGVMIARDFEQIAEYLNHFDGDVIVQKYIHGQEFGVFITRAPGATEVSVLSIVHKTFPAVVGDGRHHLKDLILADERTRLIAQLLFDRWGEQLLHIPAQGEKVQLVEIGAHCRGSLFLDATDLVSPALVATLTRLTEAIPGYAFGRMDLRVPSVQDFQAGLNLQILELNGVTAESAHIYHPGTPLLKGYRDMFKQWSLAYKVGNGYAKLGVPTTPLRQLYRSWRSDLQRGGSWF